MARGREYQDDGRHDQARAEFQRALELEPDLDAARAALEQLGEPPKKPSGGFFSRLLKK
ncbi:MAG: tetratricopeptide repeat protein [Kofleriaceae bacterium]